MKEIKRCAVITLSSSETRLKIIGGGLQQWCTENSVNIIYNEAICSARSASEVDLTYIKIATLLKHSNVDLI